MPRLPMDDGVELQVTEKGHGKPLVLVHGWMMAADVWKPQIDEFSTTHRVIAPDLRGCGASDARTGTYTMARYAADLDQVLTQLDVKNANIIGWSMGGGITMEYLARYGDARVRRIGLVDFPPRLEEDPSVADKVCNSLNTKRDTFLDGFMRRMVLDPNRTDLMAHLRAQAQHCRPETACEMYRAMRPTGPSSAQPLQIPAYLAFPKNGWFHPALDAWKQRFPTHVAPAFDRSKHCPFLEEPDAFNQTLRTFLDSNSK